MKYTILDLKTLSLLCCLYLLGACTTFKNKKVPTHKTKPKYDEVLLEEEANKAVEVPQNLQNTISLELEEAPRAEDLQEEAPTDDQGLTPVVISKEKNTSKAKDELPPAQLFRVRFKIQNNNPQPVWYLMPYHGAVTLAPQGRFKATKLSNSSPLKIGKYEGQDSSSLVELRFTGKGAEHFRAFYIPAKSSFTLSNYTIDCWKDSDKIELWAVQELWVNGQKLLQDYLPFSLLSSPNVVVRCDRNQGCNWEELSWGPALQDANDALDLDFIQAQKVKKYTVQLSK